MQRLFHHTHIVRYDECNCDGILTPAAFLRYMQGIAAMDAEDAQLADNGYWIVKRTVISFRTPIRVHTRLRLKTYGIGFTRITAQRGYEASIAEQEHEEPVIVARTLWVFVDPRGRPTRIPEKTAQIWLPDGPLPQQPETPFPSMPEGMPETTSAIVRFSDIDFMKHMNNASSVELLDNAAWDACTKHGITPDTAQFDPLYYDIEYGNSPYFGEQLTIQSWFDALPSAGQEHARWQQITRDGKTMIRAYSRWHRRASDYNG